MNYTDENRGKIQNRELALKINDFSGLRFGNITPTNIDGFMDFGNRCFVIIETKFNYSDVPYGQNLALERLCDASNVKTVYIIADYFNKEGDIDTGNCIVRKYRFNKRWTTPKTEITIKNAIEKFLSFINVY